MVPLLRTSNERGVLVVPLLLIMYSLQPLVLVPRYVMFRGSSPLSFLFISAERSMCDCTELVYMFMSRGMRANTMNVNTIRPAIAVDIARTGYSHTNLSR